MLQMKGNTKKTASTFSPGKNKIPANRGDFVFLIYAEVQGFEPWMTESESVALPLGDASIFISQIKNPHKKSIKLFYYIKKYNKL